MIKKLLVICLVLFSLVGRSPNLSETDIINKHSLYLCYEREKDLEQRIDSIRNSEFSEQLLKEYIGLVYPSSSEVVLRQFILETGWFTHKRFVVYNNIAGMKLAKIRKTTAIGEYKKHAKYTHWTASVDDYFLMVAYYKNKGYSTDLSPIT